MPLRVDQLQGAFAPLKPVYLVSGDEPLQVQEACDAIRASARQQGFSETQKLHADRSFDWGRLLESAQSMSLFGERKLIDLRLEVKLSDAGKKALQQYLAMASEDVLLITSPKLDSRTSKAAWVKSIEKAGAWVAIWPVDTQQLPRWIQGRLQRQGLNIDPDALAFLVDHVQGNLLAAHQEIQRLALLADDRHISFDLARASIGNSARFDVFDLVDACLAGDTTRTMQALDGLQGEGQELTVVLWSLGRELRQLVELAQAVEQGGNLASLINQPKIFKKRRPLISRCLQRTRLTDLHQHLQQLGRIDRMIRGQLSGDAWLEASRLCLRFSR